jgi:hypothetical protein
MKLKTTFQTSKDIKLTLQKEMEKFRVPPTMLFSVPLAHVRNLPPVMLTVKYTGSTHVGLQVDTRSAVNVETDLEVGGKYSFGKFARCKFLKVSKNALLEKVPTW